MGDGTERTSRTVTSTTQQIPSASCSVTVVVDIDAAIGYVVAHGDPVAALKAYEAKRLPFTAEVVRMNRRNPPDAILREVFERTGDKPFRRIEDVISADELVALSEGYKRVAGFDKQSLQAGASIAPQKL